MHGLADLMSLACRQLRPNFEIQKANFNIPKDLVRYENTRDPNCKGIKEREALRRIRTGPYAGLARWENP